jgi:hypothetical protein
VVDVDGEQFEVFETDLAERCTAQVNREPTVNKSVKPRLIRIYRNFKDRERRSRTCLK